MVGSVRSNLNAMLYCSDQSKELLSSDSIRMLNDIRDALSDLDKALEGGFAAAPEEALDPLVTGLMALAGLAQESMVRGTGWRFMEMGRRLERGVQTAAIIRCLLGNEVNGQDQDILIEAMLLSIESLISYRRRYRARMGVQSSLDLVMMDTSNPRSLLFQIEELSKHISQLPSGNNIKHELSLEQKQILEVETQVKLSHLTELSSREAGKRDRLTSKLDSVIKSLGVLSLSITDKYFDHRETSRQLVRRSWEAK